MAAEQGTNQSVEKTAAVLSAFADGRELRVADVVKHAGLGQSSASRLLSTLEGLEYVERDPVSSLYRLGSALITLGGVALNQHPVHREARQRAQNLAATLGLGANVAVRRGSTLFYLCNFEGRLAPKSFALIGQRNPLHATGMGKCLLLGLSADERRDLLPDLHRFTARTITDHDELDRDLLAVKERGYSIEDQELALSRACLAAPVLGPGGDVVAAISVSGPLTAVNLQDRERELGHEVMEVADAVSAGLGYLGPHSG